MSTARPYAGCDRFHREIQLRNEWRDGKTHKLALHGWTGNGGAFSGEPDTKLYMRQCSVVQIDQPTRDFIVTARVALGVAENPAGAGTCALVSAQRA